MSEKSFKDSRLLEAFDHIDPRFITEVAEELKIDEEGEQTPKSSPRRSIKYVLVLAACALLLGALIPVMNYVVQSLPSIVSGIFGGATDQTDKTLDDFFYYTEINRDHVITDAELALMNKVWLSEFGKKLAETPEEAMTRREEGNFYFGRYGKTFVFYKKQYNMDMEFSWGSHDFVFPWGEFYFLKGEKVYTREEIAETDIFTDAHIDALYDYCVNYYPSYVPEITLPEGDYVLTSDDLSQIQEAFDGPVKYSKFATLESAMRRKVNSSYYFGKFGETIIFWVASYDDLADGFEWGDYSFDFNIGRLYFYENGMLFDHILALENDLMTEDEIKAFYDHYINRFVPFNSLPYTYPEFTKGLEKLTESEMQSINASYESWKYAQIYKNYYEMYINAQYTEENAHASADRAVYTLIGYDPHRFFNEGEHETYRYYGKRGGKIFLADGDVYSSLHVFEIAGYKFVIDGGAAEIIVLFEDGEIIELSEAYESGLVTKADVAFAHERHQAYSKYYEGGMEEIAPPTRLKIGKPIGDSPIELSEELQREIVWEYIAGASEDELLCSYAVRCYGKFGETYAVMIDGPWGYFQAMESVSVAGYTFIFSDSQPMYIYKEGIFYSLRKAYELGIVTEKNIASIEWTKVAPYTYEKTTAPVELTEEEIKRIVRYYTEYGASHQKGTVYSIRCYGKNKRGYAILLDRSDMRYKIVKTVEKVGEYEFIYSTEQTLTFVCSSSTKLSLAEALDNKMIDEEMLKSIWETYRAAHPEFYD